jgi:hypothetical protein
MSTSMDEHKNSLLYPTSTNFIKRLRDTAKIHPAFFMAASVQSRKFSVDPLMGVSPGALAEEGIWTHGPR